MLALPTKINLSKVTTQFDILGQPKEKQLQEKFELMANELLWYTETLRDKRLVMGFPE